MKGVWSGDGNWAGGRAQADFVPKAFLYLRVFEQSLASWFLGLK